LRAARQGRHHQLNRGSQANAQTDQMLYHLDLDLDLDLDLALVRPTNDDEVGAIIIRGEGKHFCSGHGHSGYDWKRDVDRRTMWYEGTDKPEIEAQYVREQEMHLGLIRRWRETPKPTIAAVQGACMAGGLMLAWACDFIVAADDSFFNDPLVPMGVPGMEYFAHAFEMPSRIAKEFLMMGNRMTGTRAYALGMVNRLVTRETLMDECLANTLAERPRFALALTKQACNFVDDIKGKRTAMDRVFGMHQLAHAHNRAVYGAAAISPPKKEKK